jgi:hypothetical protein
LITGTPYGDSNQCFRRERAKFGTGILELTPTGAHLIRTTF